MGSSSSKDSNNGAIAPEQRRQRTKEMFGFYQKQFEAEQVPVMSIPRCARMLLAQHRDDLSAAVARTVEAAVASSSNNNNTAGGDDTDDDNGQDRKQETVNESAKLVIVDCRTSAEKSVSTIPCAVSEDDVTRLLDERVKTNDDTDDIVAACYCTIGYRSGKVVRSINARGVRGVRAYNLDGSILGWAHAQLPVVSADGEIVQRVHVFGKKWDVAPANYETKTFPLM
eukprot:TRINITY_DN51526_c0_g1_i1.p1 TRINITY_DN51526_c0_g1~~TRINITY_DN51526_c0_g1_i1.p1  ORF type:complete len:227 (+),score=111.73 TRINITY_DN51526_c0_g1_i1:261-941(+)